MQRTCANRIAARAPRRHSFRLVVPALGLLILGCQAQRAVYEPLATEAWSPVLRFIDEPPQWLFSADEISRRATELSWSFADDPGWTALGPGARSQTSEGLLEVRLRRAGRVRLERSVRLEAAKIDEIEIEARGLGPDQFLQLYWNHEGEEPTGRQSVRVNQRRAEGRTTKTYRFSLAGRPGWDGTITGLRLMSELEGDQRLRLRGLRATRRVLESEAFTAAVSRPWQVLLGGELRSALLALPDVPIERALEVPQGARLQLHYGLPDTFPGSLRFAVMAETEAGESVALMNETVEPRAEGNTWLTADLDLAPWQGQRLEIRLETSAGRSPDPLDGVAWWGSPRVVAPVHEVRPPNVILISIDTLRADRLSTYGYSRSTTPEIDRWAEERAVVFEQAVAAAPWTLPSHVTMFSGLDALSHGVNHPAPVPRSITTLAERLWEEGYSTRGIVGGSYLHPEFGLAQGFDAYFSYKGKLAAELEVQTEMALEWLRSDGRNRPFFLLFHTYEVHDPYRLHPTHHESFGGGRLPDGAVDAFVRGSGVDPERGYRLGNEIRWRRADGSALEEPVDAAALEVISDLYDGAIAYTDQQLGRLFRELEELGLADDTLVVLTSDHGEAFGEHGLSGHGSLYDHDLLVPLIVAFPGKVDAGRRISRQVQSADLFPTVLDTLGLAIPDGLDGASLLPILAGERISPVPAFSYAALSNHGVGLRMEGEHKYLFANNPWPRSDEREELFDLRSDPAELENLAATSKRRGELHETLSQALRRRAAGWILEVVNPTSEPLTGALQGDAIGPATVKTADLGTRARLRGRGNLEIEVPAGGKVSLRLEGITGTDTGLTFELATSGQESESPGFLEIGALGDGETAAAWWLTPEGWSSDEAAAQDHPSLRLLWRGVHRSAGPSPAETDPELRRQLQALGYID